ncbi:MAG: hypothetical protein ACLP3R_10755 [Candidatus Korobacteraceae bacterium]
MPVTAEQLQAEDTAHDQAAINDSKTKAAQASFDISERNGATTAADAHDALRGPPANTVARWAMNLPQNIGTALIDDAVNTADTFHSITGWMDQHRGHIVEDARNAAVDATSNAMTSASNAASRGIYAAVGQKAPAFLAPAPFEPTLEKPDPVDPVYDHVRDTVMNLRDHLAVQDPNAADEATQSILRVGIPALGWSRFLSGIGVASKIWKAVGTDALTGGVSQGAHDPRFADMVALGRHTEGKYIDALGTADPTGGLLNHYINFMTDRSNESEVEGRLKGALDFVLGGAAVAPLFHAMPQVLRQGYDVLAMGMDAGIGKTSDVFSGPKYQVGAIGDVKPTPRANNASGESAASLEAQSWVRAQKASGIKRYRLDPDGVPEPLMGLEGRDPRPMTGQPVVDFHKDGSHEIIDRGGMTKMQADGLVERAKALHGLGPKEEK